MSPDKYLCIHGHFYQPPRENPWLNVIESQVSARPYHDWNERITRECYSPNARARILGQGGLIEKVINNYELMSFNFGPTLLSWLEAKQPDAYGLILEADRAGAERFGGHGGALAQVYNHIIMPLASTRDKLTQIRWGLADFRARFGREAEGMWLAETAVDSETLLLMAREGLKFTILAPDQAQAVRPAAGDGSDEDWVDVSGGRVDPRRPYRVFPGPDRETYIDVFFYDGPVSRAVAYERLLASGQTFLERINGAFGAETDWPRLVHLATDGESYGHHFQFGEMALAWVFDQIEKTDDVSLINYGAFLELYPPDHEARIVENSSWSCAHGVERWRSDCGCRAGFQEGWTQAWRRPLRDGLNDLRDKLAEVFEQKGSELFQDPWQAREDYVTILLDSSEKSREEFLARHLAVEPDPATRVAAWSLLESQLMALYMFTSCGWFFDDIAGLEPVQDLKYAARAVELVEGFVDQDLEAGLLEYLKQAECNDPDYETGADVYQGLVLPSRVDPASAAGHYGLRQVVQNGEADSCPAARLVESIRQRRLTGPGLEAALGRVRVVAPRTEAETEFVFLAQYKGGRDVSCLVDPGPGFDLDELAREIAPMLERASPEKAEEAFLTSWPQATRYGLEDMIPDSRQGVIWDLARDLRRNFIDHLLSFYQDHRDLLQMAEEVRVYEPDITGLIYRIAVSEQLSELFESAWEEGRLDWDRIKNLADRAKAWSLPLSDQGLIRRVDEYIKARLKDLAESIDREALEHLLDCLKLARDLGLKLDYWVLQNVLHDLTGTEGFSDSLGSETRPVFERLAKKLGFAAKSLDL